MLVALADELAVCDHVAGPVAAGDPDGLAVPVGVADELGVDDADAVAGPVAAGDPDGLAVPVGVADELAVDDDVAVAGPVAAGDPDGLAVPVGVADELAVGDDVAVAGPVAVHFTMIPPLTAATSFVPSAEDATPYQSRMLSRAAHVTPESVLV